MLTRRDVLTRMATLLAGAVIRPRNLGALGLKPFEHPDPRPGITGEHVLPVEKLGKKKSVRESFEAARTYPEIFDGLFCACDCKGSMGHRSLLACYESEQPIGCMGCREEAELVGKLAKEGKSLAEIRVAVDKEYG